MLTVPMVYDEEVEKSRKKQVSSGVATIQSSSSNSPKLAIASQERMNGGLSLSRIRAAELTDKFRQTLNSP